MALGGPMPYRSAIAARLARRRMPPQPHPIAIPEERPELPEQAPDPVAPPAPAPAALSAPPQTQSQPVAAAPAPYSPDPALIIGQAISQASGAGANPVLSQMQQRRFQAHRDANRPQGGGRHPSQVEMDRARTALLKKRAAAMGQPSASESRLIDAEKRRAEVNSMLYEKDHPTANSFRDHLYSQGYPPGSLDDLNYDQMKSLRSTTIGPELELHRTPRTAESQAEIAGARAQRTGAIGLGYDVKRMQKGEEFAERSEDRATARALDKEARKLQLEFVKADQRLEALDDELEALIAEKGEDYVLPTADNIAKRWFVAGKKEILGGTGLDESDTRLYVVARKSGLGQYIQDAGNAPNTMPEQATAFEDFFQTGSLGAMKRRLDTIRAQGEETLDRQIGVLSEGLTVTAPPTPDGTLDATGVPRIPRRARKPRSVAEPDDDGVTWD